MIYWPAPLMKWISLGIAVLLVVAALVGFGVMMKFRPQPEKVEHVPPRTTVEVLEVSRTDHAVQVPVQGVLEPVTESRVASEVGGRIIRVAEDFHAGGAFQQGEVLVEIDQADYQAAVAQAEAALADARLALATEKARADQALRDWKRLAPGERANPLAQRQPHLESAQAREQAAASALDKARLDLERTQVRAPYPGRIRRKLADVGDFVAPGTPLAEIWRSDLFEVRLPVSMDELALVEVSAGPVAALHHEAAGEVTRWQARIVRTEGVVDAQTRTVSLVARLENPQPLPLPGLFVEGTVAGRTLQGVTPLPRKALTGPDRVVVVTPENRLEVRTIELAWSDARNVYVSRGLQPGERVSLTALASVVEGMEVDPVPATEKQPAVTQTLPPP